MDLGRADFKERVKRHIGILLSKPYRREMKTRYNLAAARMAAVGIGCCNA